jgi:uncharacterized membrane protein YgaE (UPF0421/DUF939 family)
MHIASLLRADRANTPRTMAAAVVFAAQAASCAIVVPALFRMTHMPGVTWALVSSVLVLQPGLQLSISASLTRFVANMLGAAIGTLLGMTMGETSLSVGLALAAISLICERTRLDAGVRSACASVVIVMMGTGESLTYRSLERAAGVGIGCGLGLAIQLITQPVCNAILRRVENRQPWTAS